MWRSTSGGKGRTLTPIEMLGTLAGFESSAGGAMDEDSGLTLKVRLDKTKYAWSLYRNGIAEPIKYSVPIFSSEAAAKAAGMEVLTRVSTRAK
jgi:hypothetical protein